MKKPRSLAEAQDDLEIVSIGALYRGHWEKKYWSSSRAKDRYPYPVGYCAVRTHAGTRCQMEIREGPKGPLFLVKLADEESCIGVTPDLAWKSFQKKNSPKAINWNGRRLSSNIDGSELFGLKNKVVQRLLHELVANANSTSSNDYKQISQTHENVRNQDKSSDSNIFVYLRKSKRSDTRSVKCKPEERSAKRIHKEGCTLKDEESTDLLIGSEKAQNEEVMELTDGDNDAVVEKHVISQENHNQTVADIMPLYAENMEGSIGIMNNNPEIGLVQDSLADTSDYCVWKPAQSLPGEISPLVDSSPQDAIIKEEYTDSAPAIRLSSGSSNLSSQRTDHDSEEQDITMSMMAFLLPQAIPLLKKTYRRKTSRKKMRGNKEIESDQATKEKAGGQFEFRDLNKKPDAKTEAPTLVDYMENTNSFIDEWKLGPLNTAEEVKDVIPDTYDDCYPVTKTEHKMSDTSEPTSIMKEDDKLNYRADVEIVDHAVLDETENPNSPLNECKHEPLDTSEEAKYEIADSFDEHHSPTEAGSVTCDASIATSIKKEDDKTQNDLEKADVLLSDSFLACLEEEFVNIENGRGQNDIKIEVLMSESTTCQKIENASLEENKFAGLPLDNKLEVPLGPYLHPQPVLSVTLSSKGDRLELCVLCGALSSSERKLYVYDVTSHAQPSFVGYTSVVFLSSEELLVKRNLPLGRVGLQYITDGQLLVLSPSVNAPFCSNMSFDCSCLICKLEQGNENCLKIVHVNFGFVSLVTKLMSQERATCILVCKPNYIVVFEESMRLHVWVMSPNWSAVLDEFTLPCSNNMVPSILELREIPGSYSLVLGHNGFGVFCLWDVSRRELLSKFLAPNNIILEILPLSCFRTQKSEVSSSNCLRKQLKDTLKNKWNCMQDGDVAVWLLVSSSTVSEFQKDLKATKPNRRWRLALLANNSIFFNSILDQRISAVDASADYGFAGTLDGLFYKWELVSGRKVSSIQCSESGVSCVAVDHQSGAVAVGDDAKQVLIYML